MPNREGAFAPSTYKITAAAPGRRLHQQVPSGSSSISSTTAQAIGIVFGGVLLIIILSYCLTVMRRKRDRAQTDLRLQAQAEHDEQRRAARAERRRRRLEPKGVPASVIETFAIKQFQPPEKPPLTETQRRLDRTTRGKIMDAAASALARVSVDHDADSDEAPLPPAASSPDLPRTPSTMLGKVTSALKSRSKRYAMTPRPSDAENLPPAPWEDTPDLDPSRSLAAAHRAACAAASQMGRNPPSLRRTSSDRMEPTASGRLGPHASGRLAAQASGRLVAQASGRLAAQASGRLAEEGAAGFKDPLSCMSEGNEEQPQCAICLCDFEAGDVLRVLPCEHDFHQSCIDSWMQQHRTCPLCRFVLYADPNPPPQEAGAPAGAEPAIGAPMPHQQFPPAPTGALLPPRPA